MRLDEYKIPPPKSWKKFQEMVCRLFREIWQDPHAQEFGREGQKQDGIDILGQRRVSKLHEAVQATIETPLTESKIKNDYNASQKLGIELDCFIIACTEHRDAKLQKLAANLSKNGPYKCIIWFWEDILESIADNEQIRKIYYPDITFIKSIGDSSGKLVEINDETTRYVLLITRLPLEHSHYQGALLISDLLHYNCQTYRLGDHWSRLVLDHYPKKEFQNCIGGNKYGAFLLSNWLNTFNSVDDILGIKSDAPYSFTLTSNQRNKFDKIIDDLDE